MVNFRPISKRVCETENDQRVCAERIRGLDDRCSRAKTRPGSLPQHRRPLQQSETRPGSLAHRAKTQHRRPMTQNRYAAWTTGQGRLQTAPQQRRSLQSIHRCRTAADPVSASLPTVAAAAVRLPERRVRKDNDRAARSCRQYVIGMERRSVHARFELAVAAAQRCRFVR